APLGVCERDEDLLVVATELDDLASVVELVRAELDPDRADRHGDDGDAGDRLGGFREPVEVDRQRQAVDVGERLARTNRRPVVLPRPRHSRYVRRMAATMMDGRALAERIRSEVAEEVRTLGGVTLATVLVGDEVASDIYIRRKHEAAEAAGFRAHDLRLPA